MGIELLSKNEASAKLLGRGCDPIATIETRSLCSDECPLDGVIAGPAKAIDRLHPRIVAEKNNDKFTRTFWTAAFDQVF